MHSSLTLRTNLVVICSAAAIAAVASFVTRPFPVVPLVLGVVAGATAGVMQVASLRRAPDAYRNAATMNEVRDASMSTAPGKGAVYLGWLMFPVLFGSAVIGGAPLGAIAGYAAFVCVRDSVALKAVLDLGAIAPQS